MDNILQITNQCSAKCSHCPYGQSIPDDQEIIFSNIEKQMIESKKDFILISGGEPLESKIFLNTIILSDRLKIPFRIATGGHISIKPFMNDLLKSSFFLGFSIGTDTISKRNQYCDSFYQVWQDNLEYLVQNSIPFSLTITLGEDLNLSHLLSKVGKFLSNADFIMINEKDMVISNPTYIYDLSLILNQHSNVRIKYGYKN